MKTRIELPHKLNGLNLHYTYSERHDDLPLDKTSLMVDLYIDNEKSYLDENSVSYYGTYIGRVAWAYDSSGTETWYTIEGNIDEIDEHVKYILSVKEYLENLGVNAGEFEPVKHNYVSVY